MLYWLSAQKRVVVFSPYGSVTTSIRFFAALPISKRESKQVIVFCRITGCAAVFVGNLCGLVPLYTYEQLIH